MKKVVALLLPAFCLIAISAIAQESESRQPAYRSVTVNGVGSVTTAPDQVRLSVQVNTRAESAAGAMSESSKRTRNILAILKQLGVEEKDIQTSRVTVSAILDYEKRVQPPPIVGYNGTNEFSVLFKGKLMTGVGDFMDKAVNAGATSFGGLQFETSKQRDLERDALKKAADDARARATVLAKELGATLGKVMTVSESVNVPRPLARGVMMADATTAAPIESGELSVSAQVNITFALE